MKSLLCGIIFAQAFAAATAVGNQISSGTEDAAYWATVSKRAEKIVGALDLDDAAQSARVRDVIAQQYVDLRDIHDGRDARLEALKECDSDAGAVTAVKESAELDLYQLHYAFIGRLAGELDPARIAQVKDGLTYGVAPNTYRSYTEMYLDLTDEQKRQILAWLTEAREHAMDAGSSEAKHAWFGKYKGKINNYLAAAGYDAKKAEKAWLERRKAAQGGK